MFSGEGKPIPCTILVERNEGLVIEITVVVSREIVGYVRRLESFPMVRSPNLGVATMLNI